MLEDRHDQEIEDRIFSRKKSLLTVQQYATSQGISAGVVNECAKLGVVQVRKHKNKTFIVDLPLDAGKNAREQQEETKNEQINTTERAQKLSDMVNKIFQPSRQILNSGAAVSKPQVQQQPKVQPAQQPKIQPKATKPEIAIPDLKIFAQVEEKAPAVKAEVLAPAVPQFKVSPLRKFTDSFKISLVNKILLIFMAAAMAVAAGACMFVNYQNKMQERKLENAYDSIGKLMNENDSAKRRAKLYEMDSSNWRAEAQRNQQSIASLEVELVQTKERLSQTQDNLSEVQQNHVDTLKKLDEQIQEITTKFKAQRKAE
ncbi:MAG: hypothetical protein ABFD79_18805 [Phycisphaerales bacterium]